MREHVSLALEQGACGFSSGLIYRPGRWSDTEEVTELAKMAAPYDALYTTPCVTKAIVCSRRSRKV